ncbi:hypothetical protein [Paenibacillus mucilaginosus]|nr:hypothetical protein [Paenibacillus mucilaginosus]
MDQDRVLDTTLEEGARQAVDDEKAGADLATRTAGCFGCLIITGTIG